MKTSLLGLLGTAIAAAAFFACKEDPTASQADTPQLISVSENPSFVDESTSKRIFASVLGQGAAPIKTSLAAQSANTGVATVAPDNSSPDPAGTHAAFTFTGVSPESTTVTFTGGGLTQKVKVNVMPIAFLGVISNMAPRGGDTIKIAATPLFKFDPVNVTVAFNGHPGTVLTATAETLYVLTAFSFPGPATIGGVVVTYVPGREITLPTARKFALSGDLYSGDSNYTTAPSIALPGPGTSLQMLTDILDIDTTSSVHCYEHGLSGSSKGSGPCAIYKVTVPAPGPDTLTFTLDWDNTNSDMDVYVCPSTAPTGCPEGPTVTAAKAGITRSSKPEILTLPLAAGDHYLVAELFNAIAPTNLYITISR